MPGNVTKGFAIMRIQILFLGRLVKVRFARTAEDVVRQWDVLQPGQVHGPTGLTYRALLRLGEGVHLIR